MYKVYVNCYACRCQPCVTLIHRYMPVTQNERLNPMDNNTIIVKGYLGKMTIQHSTKVKTVLLTKCPNVLLYPLRKLCLLQLCRQLAARLQQLRTCSQSYSKNHLRRGLYINMNE